MDWTSAKREPFTIWHAICARSLIPYFSAYTRELWRNTSTAGQSGGACPGRKSLRLLNRDRVSTVRRLRLATGKQDSGLTQLLGPEETYTPTSLSSAVYLPNARRSDAPATRERVNVSHSGDNFPRRHLDSELDLPAPPILQPSHLIAICTRIFPRILSSSISAGWPSSWIQAMQGLAMEANTPFRKKVSL